MDSTAEKPSDFLVEGILYLFGQVVVLRSRPVWGWERHLKWSAPATGERTAMAPLMTGQPTIGF